MVDHLPDKHQKELIQERGIWAKCLITPATLAKQSCQCSRRPRIYPQDGDRNVPYKHANLMPLWWGMMWCKMME